MSSLHRVPLLMRMFKGSGRAWEALGGPGYCAFPQLSPVLHGRAHGQTQHLLGDDVEK